MTFQNCELVLNMRTISTFCSRKLGSDRGFTLPSENLGLTLIYDPYLLGAAECGKLVGLVLVDQRLYHLFEMPFHDLVELV